MPRPTDDRPTARRRPPGQAGRPRPDAVRAGSTTRQRAADGRRRGRPAVDESSWPTTTRCAAAERDEYRDVALRLQADFENYRKRIAKARARRRRARHRGASSRSCCPVLDACEAAVVHGADRRRAHLVGAARHARRSRASRRWTSRARPFDPTAARGRAARARRAAATSRSSPRVMRTGYPWKGRVLRPAMVKVKG